MIPGDPTAGDPALGGLAADASLKTKGLMALEGALLVERGVAAGLAIEALYCVPARESWARELGFGSARPGAPVLPPPLVLPEADIARVAGYPFHRGTLAIARRPPPREAPIPPDPARATVLALPEASDPENVGSAFRSAAALGCSALLLGPSGPDPYSRRVLRVSMGAALTLPWTRLSGPEALAALRARGYLAAACVLDPEAAEARSYARPPRLVLVVGNEARGLSPRWLEACDDRITLTMSGGVDSLNAAVAAAVLIYAAGRT